VISDESSLIHVKPLHSDGEEKEREGEVWDAKRTLYRRANMVCARLQFCDSAKWGAASIADAMDKNNRIGICTQYKNAMKAQENESDGIVERR